MTPIQLLHQVQSMPTSGQGMMRDCVRMSGLSDLMQRPVQARQQAREVNNLLNDPSPGVRQMAVTVLGRAGTTGLPGLISAMAQSQPSSVRCAAIQALSNRDFHGAPALVALGRCLSDPDAVVRDQAAQTLSQMGAPALPVMREALRSPNMAAREAAASAIARSGPEAKEALDDLRDIARSSPPTTAAMLHAASVKVSGDASNGVPELVMMLHSGDPSVRRAAAIAAAEIGPSLGAAGAPLEDALMGRMRDPSPQIRAEAARSIASLAPDSLGVRQAITRLLSDPNPDVRSTAAMSLSQFGIAARPTLDAAAKQLTGRDLAFAQSAMYRVNYLRSLSAPTSVSSAASSATTIAHALGLTP